jgi:hypothetical protein
LEDEDFPVHSNRDEIAAELLVYRIIADVVVRHTPDRVELQAFIWGMILYLWKQNSNEITFLTRPEFSDVDSEYNDSWYPAGDIHVTSPLAQRDRRPDWTHSFLFSKLDAKHQHIVTGLYAAFRSKKGEKNVRQFVHLHDVHYFLSPCIGNHLLPYGKSGVSKPRVYLTGFQYHPMTGVNPLPWMYGTIRVSKRTDEHGGYQSATIKLKGQSNGYSHPLWNMKFDRYTNMGLCDNGVIVNNCDRIKTLV